jgi:3-methyladenine DNA glycosylase Tag
MHKFESIWNRASDRKGGDKALKAMLPSSMDKAFLAEQPNSYYLALMAKSIFKAGFVWRVVDKKWPTFEEAFYGFDNGRLLMLPDEEWEAYAKDIRIIRNMTKVFAVRSNLHFIYDISQEHGSFGQFIAGWPEDDLVGLFLKMKKEGSRLGGMTGQYFLNACGKSTFLLTRDVVHCLQLAGIEVADSPSSQRDLKKIQTAFNQWHAESGLSYRHMSAVMARSVGENY